MNAATRKLIQDRIARLDVLIKDYEHDASRAKRELDEAQSNILTFTSERTDLQNSLIMLVP